MKRSPKSTGLSSAENAEAMHSHLIVGHDIFPKIVPFMYIYVDIHIKICIYIYIYIYISNEIPIIRFIAPPINNDIPMIFPFSMIFPIASNHGK